MYRTHKGLAGWVQDALNWLFEPSPGTKAYVNLFYDTVRVLNEEKSKPEGERDEQRLLELYKEVLRMQAERFLAQYGQCQEVQHDFLQPPRNICCDDWLMVRQRLAASCKAAGAWYQAYAVATIEHLRAVQQGKAASALAPPAFELPLPEGVPEKMPPSIDRCTKCQAVLDEYIGYEEAMRHQTPLCSITPGGT